MISLKRTDSQSKAELKNWYKDRYEYARVWRNILAIATLLSLLISLFSVLAVRQLTPLKSVEPFVIQVDDKSGIAQTVDPLSIRELSANEAINNYFVVQYVRARETYDVSDLTYNYNVVRVMSEPEKVYGKFRQDVTAENPESFVNRLGTEGRRAIQIRSVSYINPQTAQVRLIVTEQPPRTSETKTLYRIATLSFTYPEKIELSQEERYINPLGFIVTNYRLDEDAVSR